MGLAQGGTNVGVAQGTITISTAGVTAAVPVVAAASAAMTKSLGGIGQGAAQAQSSFAGLAGAARQLAGAFGLSFGIAGAVQLGKMAIAATETATAFNRQSVAAVNLAGSQGKLNDMLAAYQSATGGAIDQATSLANVTKLMAVGFADNVPELEKFATVIRGISVAMGQSQDMVTQNLILELFTQRGARLDQLGLEYDKVKQRADELQKIDASLTAKQAYQNAVLEQAEQRYGKLAKSAVGAATGLEKAGRAAADANLAIGQVLAGPVNLGGNLLANWIENQTNLLHGEVMAWDDLYAAMQRAVGIHVPTGAQQRLIASSAAHNYGPHGERSGAAAIDPNAGAIQTVHLDWAKGIQDVNEQVRADILDEETSFGASRVKTVADYNKSVARDEQAFARTRLRANIDFLEAIEGVAKDATRREQGAAADLARTQAQAQADSEDKIAGFREDANKRLAELDADYEKNRLKRAKDVSDKLLDAAGNLDAKQVYEIQRDAAKQEKEASDAHDDARDKIGKQLDERIDDERKSLAKSAKQQQDAYDRQIEAGRENDRLKLEDMKTAFAKQQAREAEDHADQVAQRAEDQAAQLAELDTQHNLRLEQIANHAAADRKALDEQAKADLLALGVRNAAWKKAQEEREKAQEKLWDDFMKHVTGTLKEGRPNTPQIAPAGYASGGYVPTTGLAYLHAGETVIPARNVSRGGGGRSISMGDIHISVGGTNASAGDIGRVVRQELLNVFEGA